MMNPIVLVRFFVAVFACLGILAFSMVSLFVSTLWRTPSEAYKYASGDRKLKFRGFEINWPKYVKHVSQEVR